MSDIQTQVQQAIDKRVDAGTERGLHVAVYRHGDLLVDAVAATWPGRRAASSVSSFQSDCLYTSA